METISDVLAQAFQKRYATKQFDTTFVIPPDKLHILKESIRLAPSSFGLQLWKIFLIRTEKLREQIKVAAHNQPQMVEASELFLFCRPEKITENHLDQFVTSVSRIRKQPKASLVAYRQMLSQVILNLSEGEQTAWMEKQIYIALGFLLQTATLLDLDTCPLEGFNRNQVDELLELPRQGLHSVVACAVGKRSDNDLYASAPKVRYPEETIFGTL
jgi:nitroreductase